MQRDIDKEQLLCTDMLTLVPAMSTLSDRLRGNELWQLYCELEVKIIPLLAGKVVFRVDTTNTIIDVLSDPNQSCKILGYT